MSAPKSSRKLLLPGVKRKEQDCRPLFALVLAYLVAAIPAQVAAQHAPPAQPFQRLGGCIYKAQRWNDGDSFHVILPAKARSSAPETRTRSFAKRLDYSKPNS